MESTEEKVKRLVCKVHIVLARRIMSLDSIPSILAEYGVAKENGLEAISEVLDKLSENRKMTIELEPVQVEDGKYDIFVTYFIENHWGERVHVPEMGHINLHDVFSNSLK